MKLQPQKSHDGFPTADERSECLRQRRPGIVTIIYKSLPHYRIPFFEALRLYLDGRGVELRLIYGQPTSEELKKRDTGAIDWGQEVHNHYFNIGRRYLCWQPCLHLLKDTDLVVVEQQSKLLNNYLLLIRYMLGGTKLALWGHGKNFQAQSASAIGETIKKIVSRRVHWWFAYNEMSAKALRDIGYSPERITNVQNAIDTSDLLKRKKSVKHVELCELRERLELKGNNVAIYAGSLYKEKRIEYLIEAAQALRQKINDFELLVIGAGPESELVQQAANECEWIHFLGTKFDTEKVPYFLLSKVMLLPGLVGLAVIDSFALETPLVTVDLTYHSPEIEYLVDGVNGIKLPERTTPKEYAESVASLLRNNLLRERLQQGCRMSAKNYTLETMVERFADGIFKALALPKRHI